MSDSSSYLSRQLNRYKDLLANLSRKNREIFYKESVGSSLNLTKAPFPSTSFLEGKESDFSGARLSKNQIAKLFTSESDLNLHEHFEIDKIKDAGGVKKLYAKLDKIRLSDDRHQREFGISGAWLLGPFICWRPSNQVPRDEMMVSPIFKVAIDLKWNKKKQMVLNAESDEIAFNPSLLLALKQSIGFNLPTDSKFESVAEALEFLTNELKRLGKNLTVADGIDRVPEIPPKIKVIKNEDGEIVERKPTILEEVLTKQDLDIYNGVTGQNFILIDVVYLDQLNASRMVLIKDYEEIIESGVDHSILNELFNGVSLPEETSVDDRSKLKELDSYRERENYFVVDIDSTQHRAIDKATKSKAIVIQGPPGSGKSQTIVNLIADYLAKGKKVLFVSEKRPALDVVFNRMKSANIESQAVLIHSSDLNKSDLYKSFLSLANSTPCEVSEKEWNSISDSLDRVKSDMNTYAEELIATHMQSGMQAADLIVASSQVNQEYFSPGLYKRFQSFDFEKLKAFRSEIRAIQNLLSNVRDLDVNPWKYRLENVVRTNTLEHKLKEMKDRFTSLLAEERSLNAAILSHSGGEDVRSEELDQILEVTPISESYSILWDKNREELVQSLDGQTVLLQSIKDKLNKLKSLYLAIIPNTDRDTIERLAAYYQLPKGFGDWFTGQYWSFKKLRKQVCPIWTGGHSQFSGYLEYEDAFGRLSEVAIAFGAGDEISINQHAKTDEWIAKLIDRVQRLQRFFRTSNPFLPKTMLDAAKESIRGYNETIRGIEVIKSSIEKLKLNRLASDQLWRETAVFLGKFPEFGTNTERLQFYESLITALDCLEIFDKAETVVRKVSDRFGVPLKSIVNEDFSAIDGDWAETLETTMLCTWVDDLLSKAPELRSFTRDRIDSLAEEFRAVSENHKIGSREAVHQAFAKRWTQGSNRSGVSLLKKESEKQRRVLSPREIMEKGALATMLQLKPCWLMSPLSISQMLPLQKGLFDVIIFDEASQVRVEDAIPSIYRANTMIVVGDNKQMPPTNFFAGSVSDDDEDDTEIAPSVLDLASQVYPQVLLEWHYRSKAESLIAFSNRAFYGGRLIAAPNPRTLTSGGALKFNKIAEGYFTSKDGNEKEAEVLVDNLIEMLRQNPERSYGIIAMGMKQAAIIDVVVTRRMEEDPRDRKILEKAFSFKEGDADAGLFVKNLENVQGDERDVILLSVGYAPAGPNKKMRLGFGPLGSKGGGRRLNVAVTRSKSEMHVYCSFDPSVIPSDEEAFAKNPDACIFGRYLRYAKAVSDENIEGAMEVLNSFPMAGVITSRKASRFALDVKRRLEENGHKVSAEIGSSGFYIDLGIHHPVVESNYSLGVECDGAIFHSTPYARDRDKIRESLLRSRGWKITRVWSQDWSKDWRKEILRIEKALLHAANSGNPEGTEVVALKNTEEKENA